VSNLVWLLLVGAALPGCGGARAVQAELHQKKIPPPEGPVSCSLKAFNEDDDILEVALSVSTPFSDASISIDAHGYLNYYLDVHPQVESDKKHERKTIELDCEQYEDLKKLIVETGIFSIDKAAWQTAGEDCSSSYLLVRTPGGGKTFSCVCTCPEELRRIRARLEELLGKELVEVGF
jgi:hypothetical protein